MSDINLQKDTQQNKGNGKVALKVVGSLALVGTAAMVGLSYLNQGAQGVAMESNSSTFLQDSHDDQEIMRDFQSFVNRHNKNYLTKEEYSARFNIFKNNVMMIQQHNKNQDNDGFVMAVNKFTDYSPEEFGKLLGFKSNEPEEQTENDNEQADNTDNADTADYEDHADDVDDDGSGDAESDDIGIQIDSISYEIEEQIPSDDNGGRRRNLQSLPASVDWRSKGAVSSVKNQGQCGSCYAFTALAAIESAEKIFKGVSTIGDYSEQQLVDCTANAQYGNFGCGGGNMNQCFKYYQSYKIMTESSYPYAAVKKSCAYNSIRATNLKVRSYANIATNDPTAHMQAVAKQPVSIALSAATSTFQFYRSGIISSTACGTTVNHAVLLVGYGTDSAGTPYWLIKNSWGSSWGEAGYVRVRRDMTKGATSICNMLTMSSIPTLA